MTRRALRWTWVGAAGLLVATALVACGRTGLDCALADRCVEVDDGGLPGDAGRGGGPGGGAGAGGSGGSGGGGGGAVTTRIVVGEAFTPLPVNTGLPLRVYDFDVGVGGAGFFFAWVGDGALFSRAVSAEGAIGAVVRQGSLATVSASSVSIAGRVSPVEALAVGSGTDALKAHHIAGFAPRPPIVIDPGGGVPLYSDLAWNGDTALVAWTGYDWVSFTRVRADGTVAPTSPAQLSFPGSTFIPRVAVAGDGADWLVAITATDTRVYRVTAAGAVSFVGTRGAANGGASVGLVHGSRGYVLVVKDEARLLSERGDPIGGANPLPRVPGESIEVLDAAADSRHVLVLRARQDRVMGVLLDHAGVPQAFEPFAIDATPGTGERCAVAAAADGRWLVTYGTWTNGGWFGSVSARTVTVTP